MSALKLQDFLEMTVGELGVYLKKRGLSSSGSHSVLATRSLSAHEQNVQIKPTTTNSDVYNNILKIFILSPIHFSINIVKMALPLFHHQTLVKSFHIYF